jgi:GntR family transcriptional regulator, transcriptional repressor for pyruvate dehydrogenase complex
MTVDEPRAWQLVLQTIELELIAGNLGPGDHLPAERALAAQLGVGRSSVREAFRVLEVLGLIRTQTGSGPTAGAIVVARPSGGMSALMRLQVAAQGFPVSDVVKTRLALESAVVADLAVQTGADLGAAIDILDAMDADGLTAEEFLAIDARFHLALAEASGNVVITAMMAGLRDSIESYVVARLPHIHSWQSTADRLRAEHRGIVAAVIEGRPAEATERIRSHISGYYTESRVTDREPVITATPPTTES